MTVIRNDVVRILLYYAGCFLLAALIAPHLYNAGKALAEITANKETNAFLDWLGGSARRAEFSRYFKRSLALAALLLLPTLIISLRRSAQSRLDDGEWTLNRKKTKVVKVQDHRIQRNPQRFLHLSTGLLISAPVILLAAYFATEADWFTWRDVTDWSRVFRKSVIPAFFTSILEEVLFRGLLFAVFVRCLGLKMGAVCLSLVFASVHFLTPTSQVTIENPGVALAGFSYLVALGAQLLDVRTFIGEFITLFIAALILASARLRTASLWLPIGIHAGWVFAFKFFSRVTREAPERSELSYLLIDDNGRSGLVPICALLATAGLMRIFLSLQKPHLR